jgi:DNA-binding HxlR family transcriptional regulator
MAPRRFSDQNCSIARTLAVVGERWTLLVVRELILGRTRFSEIRENVGVSTNVLADRLDALVEEGIATKTRVAARGQVHDYRLTAKGYDLGPVLIALTAWGDAHAPGELGPPRSWWHLDCDHETSPELTCSHCHQRLSPGSVRAIPGPGADERQRAEGMLPAAPGATASTPQS